LYFFEKTPEESVIYKAFEAGKTDLLKALLSKRPQKETPGGSDRVFTTLLFGAINKYDKKKDISQYVLRMLQDKNLRGVVDKARGELLPLNEAIKLKEVSLVQDVLALGPNPSLQEKSGMLFLSLRCFSS